MQILGRRRADSLGVDAPRHPPHKTGRWLAPSEARVCRVCVRQVCFYVLFKTDHTDPSTVLIILHLSIFASVHIVLKSV